MLPRRFRFDASDEFLVIDEGFEGLKPGDIVKWKPLGREEYDTAVADVDAGRFVPLIRNVTFSLADSNHDIDAYNRKLDGVLHGH